MEYKSLYKLFFTNDESTFNKIYLDRLNAKDTFHCGFKINKSKAFLYKDPEIINLTYKINEIDFKLYKLFYSFTEEEKNDYLNELLINEIISSYKIEGIELNKDELEESLNKLNNFNTEDFYHRELVSSYRSIKEGFDYKFKKVEDIRALYDNFFDEEINSNESSYQLDGKLFRKNPVYVYNSTGSKIIHTGLANEGNISNLLKTSLMHLNYEDDEYESNDYLIHLSIFHFMFGYIHPFYDGNGRIARYLTSLSLSQHGFLTPVCLHLSITINNHLKDYYKAFKEVNDPRNKGDLGTFVYSFLNIIYQVYLEVEQELLALKK